MKKLINDPLKVTDEMVEGLVTAFPNLVRKLDSLNVVVRKDAPIKGKVGILAGGGSGHEPLWLGYTGRGSSMPQWARADDVLVPWNRVFMYGE